MAEAAVVADQFALLAERLSAFGKTVTAKVPIAQTPKRLVWTLNKAKLYRYVPVLPKEKRHPVPLLLVFALMNRPYILDLRPGHSFVESWSIKAMTFICSIGDLPDRKTRI